MHAKCSKSAEETETCCCKGEQKRSKGMVSMKFVRVGGEKNWMCVRVWRAGVQQNNKCDDENGIEAQQHSFSQTHSHAHAHTHTHKHSHKNTTLRSRILDRNVMKREETWMCPSLSCMKTRYINGTHAKPMLSVLRTFELYTCGVFFFLDILIGLFIEQFSVL